jgi:hypothetical protein
LVAPHVLCSRDQSASLDLGGDIRMDDLIGVPVLDPITSLG